MKCKRTRGPHTKLRHRRTGRFFFGAKCGYVWTRRACPFRIDPMAAGSAPPPQNRPHPTCACLLFSASRAPGFPKGRAAHEDDRMQNRGGDRPDSTEWPWTGGREALPGKAFKRHGTSRSWEPVPGSADRLRAGGLQGSHRGRAFLGVSIPFYRSPASSAAVRSVFFWASDKSSGMSTSISTYRSPCPSSVLTPCPRRRNFSPGCVPAGIVSFTCWP